MRSLPPEVLATIRYLGHLERKYNAAGRSPVWQAEMFPSSKKAANELAARSAASWDAAVARHLSALRRRYTRLTPSVAEHVFACHVLGLIPDPGPPQSAAWRTLRIPPDPSHEEVVRRYRTLSLLHHPDRGGDQARFIEIKRARDLLIDRTPRRPGRRARTRRSRD
jgi:hypothetical protein